MLIFAFMRLYVVVLSGDVRPRVYGSLMAISRDLGVAYHKLWRVFGKRGLDEYSVFGLDIYRVGLRRSERKK